MNDAVLYYSKAILFIFATAHTYATARRMAGWKYSGWIFIKKMLKKFQIKLRIRRNYSSAGWTGQPNHTSIRMLTFMFL